jgi:hypothetical protein
MTYPKSRQSNIVVQEMENEALIYDLTINKAFCLNSTSAQVYQLCNGKNSIADIAKLLSRQMNEPITEDLIWLALDQLKRDNLLEKSEQFEINFKGLNRRQVIRKIGFASLVALPVIASVIAPSALMAQSGGVGIAGACVSTSECQPGLSCVTCSIICPNPQFCCVGSGTNAPNAVTCAINGTCSGFAPSCCSGMNIGQGANSCGPGFEDCLCVN